jgi:3-oxoacyl-[acyl-carrier protein] reductase
MTDDRPEGQGGLSDRKLARHRGGNAAAFARQGREGRPPGRDTEVLAKIEADITNGGGYAMFVTGDVTKFADIEAIRARVEQT